MALCDKIPWMHLHDGAGTESPKTSSWLNKTACFSQQVYLCANSVPPSSNSQAIEPHEDETAVPLGVANDKQRATDGRRGMERRDRSEHDGTFAERLGVDVRAEDAVDSDETGRVAGIRIVGLGGVDSVDVVARIATY